MLPSASQNGGDQYHHHVANGAEIEGCGASQRVHLATVKEKKRLWWRNAIITTGCIGLWFTFATLLSVYNKWMFSPTRFGFPYALFVTCIHMWIQFGLAAFVRAIWPKHFRPPQRPTIRQYGQKVLPTAFATAADIGLSNTSLKDITLTFYTMVKNSSLIFVLLFAFLFRLEVFSLRLIGVIFLILVGVILMVATETSFSLSGFLIVLFASACGGLRWSLTQVLLKKDPKRGSIGLDSPPVAIFWMTPAMGVFLAVLSMIVDGWINVFRSPFFDGIATSLMTGVYILLPGIMAFCMVLSEFYLIQRVGVVPMAVTGIFKEIATISVSAWLFGDRLTLLNIFGALIAFSGIGLFTYHKYRRSIDSPVPLDAHGNPIEESEVDADILRLEETRPLTYDGELGDGVEFTSDSTASPLFSVGPEGDSDDDDRNTPQPNLGESRGTNGDVLMADRDIVPDVNK